MRQANNPDSNPATCSYSNWSASSPHHRPGSYWLSITLSTNTQQQKFMQLAIEKNLHPFTADLIGFYMVIRVLNCS
jgi:hypothetical protein